MQLPLTEYDKELMIQALSNFGKPLLNKKLSPAEKKELSSIENIIHQLAFGRDDKDRAVEEADRVNAKADQLINRYKTGL